MKIKLLDNELGPPYDYLCHHIKPEIPIWSRTEEHPDAVIGVSRYGMEEVKKYNNVIKGVWVIEPSIMNGENYIQVVNEQNNFDYIFTHNKEIENKIDPKKFVYIPHGGTHLRQDDIDIFEKYKLISFIFSNKQWNAGHRLRFRVYDEFKDKLDCYGSGVDNVFMPYKIEGLKNYAFSIVMENMISEDYFTEKILDSFLTGTIPIYYGTSNIDNYFNSDGIIKFNTVEELNEVFNSLSIEKYQSLIDVVQENFERAKKYIFPEKIIFDFIKEKYESK